jgi:hypothetical protein
MRLAQILPRVEFGVLAVVPAAENERQKVTMTAASMLERASAG